MDKLIDISWPITPDMTTYKDSKLVSFGHNKLFEKDGVRESSIILNSHTGTHIDSPAHFLQNGKTVEQISLEHLLGPCRVLDFMHIEEKITVQDFQNCDIKSGQRLLLKTKNSLRDPKAAFDKEFVYIDKEAAQFLADQKIKTVGIDYLGVERAQPDHETHKILFEHDVVIIEGVRLKHVDAGEYELVCLPLAVQGLEATPVRAVLMKK